MTIRVLFQCDACDHGTNPCEGCDGLIFFDACDAGHYGACECETGTYRCHLCKLGRTICKVCKGTGSLQVEERPAYA